MAEMNLDDVRGYWRELAGPAYSEFWDEYQLDTPVRRNRFMLIYRRLLSACLFLNHLADKAALMHGLENGNKFMTELEKLDVHAGRMLHACRKLANEAKHETKLIQEATTRQRISDYDLEGINEVLELNMLTQDADIYDMCRAAGDAFNFWRGYFDCSAKINFKQALAKIVIT